MFTMHIGVRRRCVRGNWEAGSRAGGTDKEWQMRQMLGQTTWRDRQGRPSSQEALYIRQRLTVTSYRYKHHKKIYTTDIQTGLAKVLYVSVTATRVYRMKGRSWEESVNQCMFTCTIVYIWVSTIIIINSCHQLPRPYPTNYVYCICLAVFSIRV